ncbi:hypothetical protein B0H17DRAFT_1040667 [Mycena rosella]|uniref:Uncharacterized protein n=1 Tax=Mycena rosella TaxID=1033263 RepID=A0AAD7M6Z7_MYCRO|nr:hypothetical protein B0H17DRAFT_1040667 [Mycena rosella]
MIPLYSLAFLTALSIDPSTIGLTAVLWCITRAHTAQYVPVPLRMRVCADFYTDIDTSVYCTYRRPILPCILRSCGALCAGTLHPAHVFSQQYIPFP